MERGAADKALMPETPVTEFGARLKQARVARGISLAQIANVTRISVRSLEAVERNDFSRLPGGIFTRSFVRAYAGEVGLDPEVALRQFLDQCPDEMAAVPTATPESIDGPSARAEWQEKLSWRHLAFVAGVVALLVIGYYFVTRPRPEAAGAVAQSPVAASAADPAPSVATEAAGQPAKAAAVPQAVASPAAQAERTTLAVSLSASAKCWMSITADGRTVASRLFAAGERVDASANREVVVKVGDAGAAALTINGRHARSLGSAGQLVTVRIGADTWHSLLAEGR